MSDIVIGPPKAKGAKTIPNPRGIRPQADTENPDIPKSHPPMDISNPSTRHVTADPFEMHGIGFEDIRHPLGHSVPPNHPAVVTEN